MRAGLEGGGEQFPPLRQRAAKLAAVLRRPARHDRREAQRREQRREVLTTVPAIEPQLDPIGAGHRCLGPGARDLLA